MNKKTCDFCGNECVGLKAYVTLYKVEIYGYPRSEDLCESCYDKIERFLNDLKTKEAKHGTKKEE